MYLPVANRRESVSITKIVNLLALGRMVALLLELLCVALVGPQVSVAFAGSLLFSTSSLDFDDSRYLSTSSDSLGFFLEGSLDNIVR